MAAAPGRNDEGPVHILGRQPELLGEYRGLRPAAKPFHTWRYRLRESDEVVQSLIIHIDEISFKDSGLFPASGCAAILRQTTLGRSLVSVFMLLQGLVTQHHVFAGPPFIVEHLESGFLILIPDLLELHALAEEVLASIRQSPDAQALHIIHDDIIPGIFDILRYLGLQIAQNGIIRIDEVHGVPDSGLIAGSGRVVLPKNTKRIHSRSNGAHQIIRGVDW